MKIGMLWYDKLPLPDKVRTAARYYAQKYGHAPDVCFVRCTEGQTSIDGIAIKESVNILPDHVWIGMQER